MRLVFLSQIGNSLQRDSRKKMKRIYTLYLSHNPFTVISFSASFWRSASSSLCFAKRFLQLSIKYNIKRYRSTENANIFLLASINSGSARVYTVSFGSSLSPLPSSFRPRISLCRETSSSENDLLSNTFLKRSLRSAGPSPNKQIGSPQARS